MFSLILFTTYLQKCPLDIDIEKRTFGHSF